MLQEIERLKKINEIQSQIIEKQKKAIEFYGDIKSWFSPGFLHKDKLICPDMENMSTYNCGGKLARQTTKETEPLFEALEKLK